jgi:hypothetical protein
MEGWWMSWGLEPPRVRQKHSNPSGIQGVESERPGSEAQVKKMWKYEFVASRRGELARVALQLPNQCTCSVHVLLALTLL